MNIARKYWKAFWTLDTLLFFAEFLLILYAAKRMDVKGPYLTLAALLAVVVDLTRKIAWEVFKAWRAKL